MMIYEEANSILESSLTPDNRCICKKTAIQNHAVTSNLASYADNRLIPVAAVVLITYDIQFEDWNGAVLSTQSVRYGHTPTLPTNPSRTGYTFTGWSNDPNTAPSADTVYTAQYTINSYTVTFKDWDGTPLKTEVVDYGDDATPPADPTRTGCTFIGWSPSSMTITNDTIFTAQYSYTVTFLDANGGTFSTQSVQYGGYATAPGTNPTKTGYTFTGWSPNPASTQITGPTTFTQWSINSYTIRFLNYNGAELQSRSVNYGVTPTYEGSTPYKGQYQTFIGWSPSIVPATQNQDYVAQFRDDTPQTIYYNITWYDPDGILSPSTQTVRVESGTTPTPPTIPSRTDYVGSWGTITAATENKTYTLSWTYTGITYEEYLRKIYAVVYDYSGTYEGYSISLYGSSSQYVSNYNGKITNGYGTCEGSTSCYKGSDGVYYYKNGDTYTPVIGSSATVYKSKTGNWSVLGSGPFDSSYTVTLTFGTPPSS